ncbi:MAG: hypothetical protein ABSG74_01695 [Candidatus Bathyarchaeia archaeon]|jgi:hypothetical protein
MEPKKFLEFFQHLRQDYGLTLNEIEFPAFVLGDEKRRGIVRPIEQIVNFVIYCNVLEQMGLDVRNLIGQINSCTDLSTILHANSLATLSFIYKTAGYDIAFLKNGADFTIKNIKADLKTRQPPVLRKPRQMKITRAGVVDIPNEVILAISKRISSRYLGGCKQAQLLFFDMSNDMEYSGIDLFTLPQDKLPEPSACRLIFYQTRFYLSAFGDRMVFKRGELELPLPARIFPNLHGLRGYWIDIERSLWELFAKLSV